MLAVSKGVELELSWLKGFEGNGGHVRPLVKLYINVGFQLTIILGHETIFNLFQLLLFMP